MPKSKEKIGQEELFDVPILDVTPIKQAIATSMRGLSLSREQVADRMTLYLGKRITKSQINDWCTPSKPAHLPRADELLALVFATGRPDIPDAIAQVAKFRVIDRKDAELLEIARLEEEETIIQEKLAQMRAFRRGRK